MFLGFLIVSGSGLLVTPIQMGRGPKIRSRDAKSKSGPGTIGQMRNYCKNGEISLLR